ncbi:CDP-alcohol phosphatidyltransferase family protein [Oricola cellulosilytica]|uniref:CDP-alcohol phosphatidyltransferase family protein n=1 Tax=Oricola cellulosilytica TaxID=1429082 RepID=A0A4R0PF97_9HYPH|nr:CDP-alcohol phosphatidyltransferase family protein [Oricola cellulosilytica]TCD16507.1 CDP-alcohol phosphatidyltransferase family protein [Oricola cellulosilytica]
MLDDRLRPKIDLLIDPIARRVAAAGVTANTVTVAGLVLGLAAAASIAAQAYLAGLALVLASRLFDGLDGAVARVKGKTDFGGYLDIVLDFAFYGAIPLGFVLADPQANAIPGAVLIFSFYVNGASFLAFAIMAEKNDLASREKSAKSFFFSTGLAEATETLAVFVLACLVPEWFPALAYLFAAICFYTALSRIVMTGRLLG